MKNSIKFRVVYNFSRQDVWHAITAKEAVSEWLMPCNIEPVVGHKFQFKTRSFPGFNGIIDCEVLEVVEYEVLVYSWSGGSLKNTKVRFELQETDGKTILNFEHSGFEGVLNRLIVQKMLSNGWKSKILPDLLKKYLENHG